ncbi:MAG: NYN domain-containing protein [Chloroflexota bacterium]
MRHIIVDGYNVIRADPRLQGFERQSLEHARDVLARTLASSPRLANDRIVIVWDGTFGTRTHVHNHRIGRVEMLYSARGQQADDVIVAEAEELGHVAAVVVVTNDVAVRERCRAAGCTVSGVDNLLDQMPGRAPTTHVAPEADDRPSSLSTVKRGNPRRSGKKNRQQREIRF